MAQYPDAPWHLEGPALQAVFLLDAARARAHVPDDLRIVEVFPGKSLALLTIARYVAPSTLAYSELIVCPALASDGRRKGLFVSHLYVDDLESQAGGRSIWKLDKRLASFEWGPDASCSVRTRDAELCQVRAGRGLRLPTPPLPFWAFGNLPTLRSHFGARAQSSRARVGRVEVTVPLTSPLVGLVRSGRMLGAAHAHARLVVEPPSHERALGDARSLEPV